MSNGQKPIASDYEQRKSQVRVLPSAPKKAPQMAGFWPSVSNIVYFFGQDAQRVEGIVGSRR